MYFASVLLLLLVFPLASIAVEAIRFGHSITDMSLIGEWFVFWAVGNRLFLAGLRQVFQPSFTAIEIFEIHEPRRSQSCVNWDSQICLWGFLGLAASSLYHAFSTPVRQDSGREA